MAKILYSALVSDMRNKLNGSVMSRNRYGSYVRTKSTPTNPQSLAQQSVRSLFGNLSQGWRALTDAQRQAWISAAQNFPVIDIFGNPRILSGNALFQSLNQNLILAGLPTITNPPLPAEMPTISLASATAQIIGGNLSFSITVLSGHSTLEELNIAVRATPPLSPGVSYFTNQLRTIENTTIEVGTDGTNISSLYVPKFGVPEVGQKIGFEFYAVHPDSGQATVPVRSMVTVVQGS